MVLLLYHDHRILSSTILSYYLTDVSLHCANCTKHLLTSELKKTKRSKFRQWKRSHREAPFLCNVLCSMEPTLTALKELDAFYGRFVRFGYSIFRPDNAPPTRFLFAVGSVPSFFVVEKIPVS